MPATQIQRATVIEALTVACRAPSLHNSQPWRWVLTEGAVDLFADPARTLRAADPAGREALISCGAALDHFRVAMAAAGWDTDVRRLPDPGDPLHIAHIEFTEAPDVTDSQRRRADAILVRRSDRLPLATPPEWDALTEALRAATHGSGVRLDAVPDEHRHTLARAAQLAEAAHRDDSDYRSELCWWTAAFAANDGIPRGALLSAAESHRVEVGRTFPITTHSERRREMTEDDARVVVLSTDGDARDSVLRCGEALSAILLDIAMAGMSSCTLTHVTEISEGRDVVAALLGTTAIPQVLVRVGVAPPMDTPTPPTPRRPIRDMIEIRRGAPC